MLPQCLNITPPPYLDVHWTSLHPASGAGELGEVASHR